jgi:hypothetical protein
VLARIAAETSGDEILKTVVTAFGHGFDVIQYGSVLPDVVIIDIRGVDSGL